jgi:hypothetical protein
MREQRVGTSIGKVGPKKRKGLESEPLQQNPISPRPEKAWDIYHPGKIKNHLASTSATAMPRIVNTYAKPQPFDSKSFVLNMCYFWLIHAENIYNFSQ